MEYFELKVGESLAIGDIGTVGWDPSRQADRTRLIIDADPSHSVASIRSPGEHTQRLGLARFEESAQISGWDDGHERYRLSADDVRKLVRDPWVYCPTFRLNGRAVAFAAFERHERALAILRVIVDPQHRRKGFGQVLLSHARDMLDRRRRVMAVCAVPEADHIALAWLSASEYCGVGVGRDEGVVLMGRRYF